MHNAHSRERRLNLNLCAAYAHSGDRLQTSRYEARQGQQTAAISCQADGGAPERVSGTTFLGCTNWNVCIKVIFPTASLYLHIHENCTFCQFKTSFFSNLSLKLSTIHYDSLMDGGSCRGELPIPPTSFSSPLRRNWASDGSQVKPQSFHIGCKTRIAIICTASMTGT